MAKITAKTETIENVESALDPSKTTQQMPAVADQDVEQSREAYSEFASDAETTQKAPETTFEMVKPTGNEVSQYAISTLHANAEAYFTHLEALATVKSLSEFVELQTDFLRKQMERSIEQARNIQALTMRATKDASKPIKDAFEKALNELRAA